jgi:2-hydroxychromene-2-carboxylate isomerase
VPNRVLHFFGFTSPFVALADARIDALLGTLDVELLPIPLVPRMPGPSAGPERRLLDWKLEYNLLDATRTARRLGIPWVPPWSSFSADSTDAVVGWYVARDAGAERAYRRAVLEARWGRGLDISDRAVLARCAAASGAAAEVFAAALEQPEYRERVLEGDVAAAREKVFGVPFFVVDRERFWGNDRLDARVDRLKIR